MRFLRRVRSALLALLVAVAIVPLGATAAVASSGQVLQLGSKGANVTTLQRYLDTNQKRDYFAHPVYTATFGSVTNQALKAWEADNGYRVNGKIKIGSAEWKLLAKQGGAKRPAVSNSSQKLDPRCYNYSRSVRVACVDLTTKKLRYMEQGKVIRTFAILDGKPGSETRESAYVVFGKAEKPVSTITGTEMPYSIKFSGGQYIHYSQAFEEQGYNRVGSLGCINIRTREEAAWLYQRMRVDVDVVVTYRS